MIALGAPTIYFPASPAASFPASLSLNFMST